MSHSNKYVWVSNINPTRIKVLCFNNQYIHIDFSQAVKSLSQEEFLLNQDNPKHPNTLFSNVDEQKSIFENNNIKFNVGDIISCKDIKGFYKDDGMHLIKLETPEIIGNGNEADFFEKLNIIYQSSKDTIICSFYNLENLEIDISEDRSKGEPDSVIAVSWKDENGENKSYIIGSTGHYMFHIDETVPTYCGLPDIEDSGIWILKNGDPQYCRGDNYNADYDSYLHGNWENATMEDIKHITGMDEENLLIEIIDIIDDIYVIEPILDKPVELSDCTDVLLRGCPKITSTY